MLVVSTTRALKEDLLMAGAIPCHCDAWQDLFLFFFFFSKPTPPLGAFIYPPLFYFYVLNITTATEISGNVGRVKEETAKSSKVEGGKISQWLSRTIQNTKSEASQLEGNQQYIHQSSKSTTNYCRVPLTEYQMLSNMLMFARSMTRASDRLLALTKPPAKPPSSIPTLTNPKYGYSFHTGGVGSPCNAWCNHFPTSSPHRSTAIWDPFSRIDIRSLSCRGVIRRINEGSRKAPRHYQLCSRNHEDSFLLVGPGRNAIAAAS